MKIPRRIVGFLELNDSKCSFEFDKELFELRLYHQNEMRAFEILSDGLKSFGINMREHKWVDRITLKGKTSESYTVYFGTSDNPSNYNGYRTYDVEWYYITDDNQEMIDEIRVYGREVDYLYYPTRTFQHNIRFKGDKYASIESISVDTVECEALDCGQYSLEGIQTTLSFESFAIVHTQSPVPLDSKSFLKLRFSRAISIDEMIDKARNAQALIKYCCYRTNCYFTDISSFVNIDNSTVRNCGKLVFKQENSDEQNEKAKDRVIKAEYINKHIAGILNDIDNGKIPFGHFCKSIDDISHYPASRIIMILASFEREFRNIYGQDIKRSDEYKEIKIFIAKLIEEQSNILSGKQKKYVKGFAKGIENSDSSYGDKLNYALNDCKMIMEPFVTKRYEGYYEEIASDVSISINELRNGIAHSRLDIELEARHLTDIRVVEEMIYVIRLKNMEVENLTIQKIINELFKENLAI